MIEFPFNEKAMDRLKKLKYAFDVLNEDYAIWGSDVKEDTFLFLLHLKVSIFISKKLYRCSLAYPDIVVDRYSDIMYEGYPVDEYLEYIMESKITSGILPDFVLTYFDKSPHWDIAVRCLYVDWDEDYVKEDKKGFHYIDKEYIQNCYEDFFEEEVYENEEFMNKVISYYDVGADFTEDLCIIKSSLYPYLKKFEEVAKTDYPDEVKLLKEAYAVISAWLNGRDVDFQTEKYGYFLSSDDSDESYGYTRGCILHNRAMVVAAELIERIMFSLDEIYHILPGEILRKEESWIREREKSLII